MQALRLELQVYIDLSSFIFYLFLLPNFPPFIILGWGDTSGIDLLTDGIAASLSVYFKTLSDRLVTEGLVRGISLRGAPYDFRFVPTDEWLSNMQKLVEETYALNGNKKVILISHSMGCLYSQRFLNFMSTEWKDKYIQLWIPIAGVFHGSTDTVSLMASGHNEGVPTVSDISLREEQRTYETNFWMLPSPSSWSDSEPLAIIGGKTFTSAQYEEFFTAINYNVGWKYYQRYNKITDALTPPGVPVYALFSKGVETPKYYVWSSSDTNKPPSSTVQGDGDGTVPYQSLTSIKKWANGNGGKSFDFKEYDKISHAAMVTDKGVIDFIVSIIKQQSFKSDSSTLELAIE